MLITRIEEGKNKKYRIFSDEVFLFSLYGKELRQFNIKEDTELSNDIIMDILDSIIYKRAKERALFLLERKPLSIHMMKDKLRDNEYPLEIVDKVISFLEKYHYLDDAEYIRMYVSSYSQRKSRKQLVNELYRKGIPKDIIEEYFEENEYSDQECFVRQFQRYTRNKDLRDYVTRQKIFRYFYCKGFSASLIESHLNCVK